MKGKVFVETSTILPETADQVAEIVEKAGAEFVTCPGEYSLVPWEGV